MGRGEHPWQNHHKILLGSIYYVHTPLNIETYREKQPVHDRKKKIKAYGQLVLLGFDVTTFTPVAYQRHSL